MSTSDEIKEYLESEYSGAASDWKRLSKKRVNGHEVREFRNKKTGIEIIVVGDDSFFSYEKSDKMTYAIVECPDILDETCIELVVSFSTQSFWDRNKYLYDQHMSSVLEYFGVPEDFTINEDMENSFSFEAGSHYDTAEKIHALLQPFGFVHNEEMETFLRKEV